MWRFSVILVSLCVAMGGLAATIRVPGDYPTVEEAIAASSAGDVIEIEPGHYGIRGLLRIAHDLVLRGIGHPVLKGLLISFEEGKVVLQGLELRGPVGVFATAQLHIEDCYVEEIRVTGGSVEFRDTGVGELYLQTGQLAAEASTFTTVHILGGSATFESCELDELGLYAQGESALTGSTVTGRIDALGGSLALSSVDLRGPVSLTGDAGLVAEDCTFYAGITLKQGAQAVLRGARITGGETAGIELEGEAMVSLYDVTVSGLDTCAVYAKDEASLLLERCTISDCADGLHLTGSARAEVRGSRFAHNARYGIAAWGGSRVEGRDNEFVDNGCDLLGNVAPAVRTPFVEPRYRELTFPGPGFSSLQQAVDALLPGGTLRISPGDYAGTVTITKEVTLIGPGARLAPSGPELPCVSVVPGAKLAAVGITVTGGQRGIFAAGPIELQSVTVISNGVAIELIAAAMLFECLVEDNDVGIRLHPGTAARIVGSGIVDNADTGVFLGDGTRLEMVSTTVEGNGKGIGLYLKECGYPWGPARPNVEVRGSGNVVRGNSAYDLCPRYPGSPWPEGFLAES